MSDRLFLFAQRGLPKQALTSLAGRAAHARWGGLTTAVIRRFIRRYGVNMAEAANPDPAAYPTFNEFFTRALRDCGLLDLKSGEPFAGLVESKGIERRG